MAMTIDPFLLIDNNLYMLPGIKKIVDKKEKNK